MSASILIVDDDDDIRGGIARVLRAAGHAVDEVDNGREALDTIKSHDPDLVLLDVHMPGMSGIDVLSALRERGDRRAVLMISAAGTIDIAVRAVQLGALDFLEKPTRTERLLLSIDNALRFARLKEAHDSLREELGVTSELVGASEPMENLRKLIAKIAPTEGRVLILGENGTGKELAANAIHAGSSRKSKPFIKVNCGAIPKELIESELFGHEKGAFTGAVAQKRGKFELAHGGTLFLDEIGDMPLAMQVKLLRVLQEGTIDRIGGSRSIQVDVRVLAATNRDLASMAASGEFREDLYYRLDVITLQMPPLRERRSDIPELACVLLERARKRHGQRPLSFDDDSLRYLSQLDFPGNVRELGNLVERLLIMAEGPRIGIEQVHLAATSRPTSTRSPGARFVPGVTYRELVRTAEREILTEAIRAFGGNKSAAARALGLERAHFTKKCRMVGLQESTRPAPHRALNVT